MPNTVDPLGGSYYIESLTNEIETARPRVSGQDRSHGRHAARPSSAATCRQEIQNAAYDFQQAVDRLETVVVGVNRFATERGDVGAAATAWTKTLERKQVERLRALRARRDQQKSKAALQTIEDAARSGENLMPRIIHAVESYCTVGEISDSLRKVFGEYKEAVVI